MTTVPLPARAPTPQPAPSSAAPPAPASAAADPPAAPPAAAPSTAAAPPTAEPPTAPPPAAHHRRSTHRRSTHRATRRRATHLKNGCRPVGNRAAGRCGARADAACRSAELARHRSVLPLGAASRVVGLDPETAPLSTASHRHSPRCSIGWETVGRRRHRRAGGRGCCARGSGRDRAGPARAACRGRSAGRRGRTRHGRPGRRRPAWSASAAAARSRSGS